MMNKIVVALEMTTDEYRGVTTEHLFRHLGDGSYSNFTLIKTNY